jgi:hypothetical protein
MLEALAYRYTVVPELEYRYCRIWHDCALIDRDN